MITEIAPTPGDRTLPDAIQDAQALLSAVDDRQAHVLREWVWLCGSGAMPDRAALKPERIVDALPVSALIGVEWNDAQPVFRARIEGRMVIVAFGESRGRSFDAMFSSAHLEQVLPAFHEAAHRGRVTLTPVAAKTRDGRSFDYTRLLLPFADDAGQVVRILAVYGFDPTKLSTLTEPLAIGDVLPPPGTRRVVAGQLRLRTG